MRAPKQANEMSPFQNDQKTNDNDINPYEGRTSVSGNGLTRGANTGSGKDELINGHGEFAKLGCTVKKSTRNSISPCNYSIHCFI